MFSRLPRTLVFPLTDVPLTAVISSPDARVPSFDEGVLSKTFGWENEEKAVKALNVIVNAKHHIPYLDNVKAWTQWRSSSYTNTNKVVRVFPEEGFGIIIRFIFSMYNVYCSGNVD